MNNLQHQGRVLKAFWQRFERHQGMLRASALSFDTTLSLIPLMAVIFVGLKVAGIHNMLAPYLLKQLAGNSHDVGAKILEYINNVKVGSLSIFGVATLLVSLFSLLEKIRDAFNTIWDTTDQRCLLKQLADYFLLVCAAPFLMAATFGMTSFLQSRWLIQWLITNIPFGERLLILFSLTPYICSTLVLMLTYRLLSGVHVRFKSALFGGVIAGIVWQFAHWAYFHFQFGIARYNAIYGALAMVPFMLLWIYTSWLVVLLGLEIVRCHQQGGIQTDTDVA